MKEKQITPEEAVFLLENTTAADYKTATNLFRSVIPILEKKYERLNKKASFYWDVLQFATTCVYNAGRIQGIRDERAKRAAGKNQ